MKEKSSLYELTTLVWLWNKDNVHFSNILSKIQNVSAFACNLVQYDTYSIVKYKLAG